ncbi:MAG: hypothetical protein LBL99_00970 [Holosporaceae bacterium]|jgi:hypothetical protein|nr:hypothetical protein [Holosporaceae bacterium]
MKIKKLSPLSFIFSIIFGFQYAFAVDNSVVEEISSNEDSYLASQEEVLKMIPDRVRAKQILADLFSRRIALKDALLKKVGEDPQNTPIEVDLFFGSNMPIMFSNAIDYITDVENTDRNFDLPNLIAKNAALRQKLETLRNSLQKLSSLAQADFSDEHFSATYEDATHDFLDVLATAAEDSSFGERHYFVRFLNAAQKAFELVWTRHCAEEALAQAREALEKEATGSVGSKTISVSVNIPTPMPSASVSLEASKSESYTGNSSFSFFTTSSGKRGKAGIKFDFSFGKATATAGIEQISSNIFYSLEQVIDAYNSAALSKFQKAQFKKMKTVAKGRKDLQQREKELLVRMEELEGLLNIFKVLPNGVKLNWVDVTKSRAVDKSKETNVFGEISAAASAYLADLGITLKTSSGVKTYSKESALLSLINEDCSPNGIDSAAVVKIIGKEFDFSQKLPDPGLLVGHLEAYVGVLVDLANADSDDERKALTEKKHTYEGLLCPKKTFGSYGRVGVLRTCVATAAVLRERDITNARASAFKRIHIALDRLAKLKEFSKNESGIRKKAGYGAKDSTASSVRATVDSLSALAVLSIIRIGDIEAFLEKRFIKGSPLKDENGKYITIKFSLPLSSVGAVGMKLMRDKLGSVLQKASANQDLGADLKDFDAVCGSMSAFEAEEKAAKKSRKKEKAAKKEDNANIAKSVVVDAAGIALQSGVAAATGGAVDVKFYGSSSFEFVFRRVDPPRHYSKVLPLPGEILARKERGAWILDNVSISNTIESGIGAPASLPISPSIKSSFGKVMKKIGGDSLHAMISKSDALMMGQEDDKTANTAYAALRDAQSEQLLKIFRNINRPNSNARFELQTLYNEIAANASASDQRSCDQSFRKFLDACRRLDESAIDVTVDDSDLLLTDSPDSPTAAAPTNARAIKTAMDSFDEIVRLNFKHNFKPNYDRAFSQSN